MSNLRKRLQKTGQWQGATVASKMSLCFCVISRYLRRLHFSLKKGRWNSKEEEKLIELIEKHGVGKFSSARIVVALGWR